MAKRKQETNDDVLVDILVLEREKEPPRYTVILHNDDFTTQEFVVHVLMSFFQKNQSDAFKLMLKVHLEGKARVGAFTKDIAESKVAIIASYSRQNGMPLLLTVEPL